MEHETTFVGNPVIDRPLEFRSQGQHGAEHFSQGREVVIGDPSAKPQQVIVKNRRSVERADNVFCLNAGRAVVQLDDNSRHSALPKRHQHTSTHHGLCPVRNAIGEGHIQGNG